jgi:hypothetical protein
MQVTSASSHAVLVSVSVSFAAGETTEPASSERVPNRVPDVGDRPRVERGDHDRHLRHDEFRPSTRLKALFERIDSNRDGGIDAAELGAIIDDLKQQDPTASLPSAEEALAKLDRDGDGTIGRRELKRALQSRWRERVQGGTSRALEPPAPAEPSSAPVQGPIVPRSASPAPQATPTDGPPKPPEESSQAPTMGRLVFVSATMVTIAIRAYASVAQATEAQSTARA